MQNRTRLRFLSVYRGVSSYQVEGGPMNGERVTVRHEDADWYRRTGDPGAELSGMVETYGRPVTPDVMAQAHAVHSEHHPDSLAALWNGRWDGQQYVQAEAATSA